MKLFKNKSKKNSKSNQKVLQPDYITWYNPATYMHFMIDEQWDGNIKSN